MDDGRYACMDGLRGSRHTTEAVRIPSAVRCFAIRNMGCFWGWTASIFHSFRPFMFVFTPGDSFIRSIVRRIHKPMSVQIAWGLGSELLVPPQLFPISTPFVL